MNFEIVKNFFLNLQENIFYEINKYEKKNFKVDNWKKDNSFGSTRIIEKGSTFDRGGINFSYVHGNTLPSTSSTKKQISSPFEAAGVSLVLHPINPYVPTVHMNLRFFSSCDKNKWWFGGGMDLTPYYGFIEDVVHFHKSCKDSLDKFDKNFYPKFKKWCDDYFYIKHRNEPRGVGGIFFDDLNSPNFNVCFRLIQEIGNGFKQSYFPILIKRKNIKWTKKEKDFQLYRRGRYVEFNLVQDRGTLFGLQSKGRIESILMSLPSEVNWRYDWTPEDGSEEKKLYDIFLKHKDWV